MVEGSMLIARGLSERAQNQADDNRMLPDRAVSAAPVPPAACSGPSGSTAEDAGGGGVLEPFPEPGTEAFAALCRSLDRRPLGYRFAKRAFDIAFSAAVIVVGLIPCAILSVAVAADTKGSPIYTQERVGRLGRPFRIYKFRSMVADADDVGKYLDARQLAQWERERKVDDDPRITRLGRVLRRTSLDELPQFVNVLKGQMSVIGPRVISFDELSNYEHRDVPVLLSVPQGITGPWQAGPRNEASFDNGQRQAIELSYARRPSVREDLKVFFSTLTTMFVERTGR